MKEVIPVLFLISFTTLYLILLIRSFIANRIGHLIKWKYMSSNFNIDEDSDEEEEKKEKKKNGFVKSILGIFKTIKNIILENLIE